MLTISELPDLTFVGESGTSTLRLSWLGPAVAARAEAIAAVAPDTVRIGLVSRTGPELVLAWLATLAAGREPCILHYPTTRLNRDYWRESTLDTARRCGIDTVLVAPELDGALGDVDVQVRPLPVPAGRSEADLRRIDGSFLQLSSGTTGHKKAIRYSLATAVAHARRYADALALDADDRIVSWLPLYHDMGFVACFLLPLITGTPAVLLDPVYWVEQPARLFDAITAHRGTTCWMPNFAFEVMSRQERRWQPSMRRWISCSEPARIQTIERFCAATGTDPARVSTCYAMAENMFAVSQSDGLVTRDVGGERRVSCGPPVAGSEVRVVDGELWVRSPSSLDRYVGSDDLRDADGFYATGDVGAIVDGDVVVLGRTRDVLNCAGQKYLLSDLDDVLNRVLGAGGRGAALADVDDSVPGTEVARCLVERADFWDTRALPGLQRALREATGLATLFLHFVPPAFITKTSSGKINRSRTLQDWRDRLRAAADDRITTAAPLERVRHLFPDLPADVPIGEVLDSLGLVALQLLCEECGWPWDPTQSIDDLARQPSVPQTAHRTTTAPDAVRLVVLADRDYLWWMDGAFAAALTAAAGAPVEIDFVCAPPSFALLDDLVFHDHFLPRDTSRDYTAVSGCLRRIKQASAIVVDDVVELWFPSFDLAYPTLSHRFERSEGADRLGLRWTPYVANHHQLPIELVDHHVFPAGGRSRDIASLAAYLGVPVFRRASTARFANVTRGWESRTLRADDDVLASRGDDADAYRRDLLAWVHAHAHTFPRRAARASHGIIPQADRHHFCSAEIAAEAVDFLVDLPYHSYCISGIPASVPSLAARLRARGRSVRFTRTLRLGSEPVDCVIQTGTWGVPDTDVPCFSLMNRGPNQSEPLNVPPDVAARWPGWRRRPLSDERLLRPAV